MDYNLILVVITITTLIAPIITCFIDNLFKCKQDKIKNYELAKRSALENFVSCASEYDTNRNSPLAIQRFNVSLNNLYIYFQNVPSSVATLPICPFTDFRKNLQSITIELAKEVTRK